MSPEVGAGMAGDYRRLVRRLAGAARRARTRADGEAIHDLRVAARRLAAWLEVWKPALRRRARRRLRRGLRRLRATMGRAREAQVHERMLRERLGDGPGAAVPGATRLLERFEARSLRRERRASRALVHPRARRLLRAIHEEAPFAGGDRPVGRVDPAHRRIERLRRRAADAVERARGSGHEEAHEARIAVKRCRYALERLAATTGDEPAAELAALAAAQEALGRLHDLATLAATLERDRDRALEQGEAERARAASVLLLTIERERREAHAAIASLPGPRARATGT